MFFSRHSFVLTFNSHWNQQVGESNAFFWFWGDDLQCFLQLRQNWLVWINNDTFDSKRDQDVDVRYFRCSRFTSHCWTKVIWCASKLRQSRWIALFARKMKIGGEWRAWCSLAFGACLCILHCTLGKTGTFWMQAEFHFEDVKIQEISLPLIFLGVQFREACHRSTLRLSDVFLCRLLEFREALAALDCSVHTLFSIITHLAS